MILDWLSVLIGTCLLVRIFSSCKIWNHLSVRIYLPCCNVLAHSIKKLDSMIDDLEADLGVGPMDCDPDEYYSDIKTKAQGVRHVSKGWLTCHVLG